MSLNRVIYKKVADKNGLIDDNALLNRIQNSPYVCGAYAADGGRGQLIKQKEADDDWVIAIAKHLEIPHLLERTVEVMKEYPGYVKQGDNVRLRPGGTTVKRRISINIAGHPNTMAFLRQLKDENFVSEHMNISSFALGLFHGDGYIGSDLRSAGVCGDRHVLLSLAESARLVDPSINGKASHGIDRLSVSGQNMAKLMKYMHRDADRLPVHGRKYGLYQAWLSSFS